MSARTPFFPENENNFSSAPESTTRPASRAHNEQNLTTNKPQFLPDQSNPLHASSNTTSSEASLNNFSAPGNNNSNAALNVGGLLRKNQRRAPKLTNDRRSTESIHSGTESNLKMYMRGSSFTQQRDSHANQLQAPIPRLGHPLLSATDDFNFKNPAFPSTNATNANVSCTSEDTSDVSSSTTFISNNNSTSSKTSDFKAGSPHSQNKSFSFSEPISSPSSLSIAPPQNSELGPPTTFKLDTTLPNQTGPRRVLIDITPDVKGHEQSVMSMSKRMREEIDELDDEHDTGMPMKRYKNRNEQDQMHNEFTYRSRGHQLPHNRSHTRTPQHLTQARSHSHDHRHDETTSHPPSPHQHYTSYPQISPIAGPPRPSKARTPEQEQGRSPDPLSRLLGCDTDAYVADHIEAYERAVKRWEGCEMDEWVKGAEEIMAKHAKLLDFVKNHMTTKLQLFTTFDTKIDAHNKELTEREKTLVAAKEKLVKEGGNVLGLSVGRGCSLGDGA